VIEIEKKFLLNSLDDIDLSKLNSKEIKQGYLSVEPVVRIRLDLNNADATLTIKGPGTLSRAEFNYEISSKDAVEMFNLCSSYIHKTRYFLPQDEFTWEIDIFHGKLTGLFIAEIELKSETDTFIMPKFIKNAKDITEDPYYQNNNLINFT